MGFLNWYLNFVQLSIVLYKMSNLIKVVGALEHKISELLEKYEYVKQQNDDLTTKVKALDTASAMKSDQLRQWEEKFSALKNANAMLGSDKYKRETKLKINALVRDIDMCIAQLSE